jgi:hypothetical protein
MHIEWLKIFSTAFLSAFLFFAVSVTASAQSPADDEQALPFASPQEAAKFLVEALQTGDLEQLEALFGKGHMEILFSGNDNADADNRKAFAAAAKRHMRIEETHNGQRATLYVGDEEWPFPVPLLKNGQTWVFDAVQGKEELLNRRIGRNELNVLRVLRGYVAAQFEYAGQDRDGDGIAEYAQKLASDPGTQNGLFWPVPPGMPQSPLGALIAYARTDASPKDAKEVPPPYHGYYYKILYRQGSNAPGGKYMYVINGNMIAGFGLAAFPAKYGESGIYTFAVNHRGEIYQRDLGAATAKAAAAMKDYNPDENWQPVKQE